LDSYLQDIANTYGIEWSPEPRPQEMYLPPLLSCDCELTSSSVNSLSELLDPDATTAVDLPQLQKLCSRGQDLNLICAACTHLIQEFPMSQVGFVPEFGSEFYIFMLTRCSSTNSDSSSELCRR
jgi:hypothetical protein